MSRRFRFAVVGAGPAGALLAGLLARGGEDVLMVGPHRSDPPTRLQSLAPAAIALLLDEGVDLAGVARPVPIDVRWPGAAVADEANAVDAHLCDRAALDAALLAWAVLGGAAVVDGRATGVADGVIEVGEKGRWPAEVIVNAAGARSVLSSGRRRLGPGLFGLASDVPCEPDRVGISIEAVADGWVWTGAAGDGRMSVLTTHADPPARRHALDAHLGLLATTSIGTDLTPIDVRPMEIGSSIAADPERPTVGDAAVTIDPLAGQGVAVALRSAAQMADHLLHGAELVRPAELVGETHRSMAHAYYRLGAAAFGTPFWTRHLEESDADCS